MSEEIKDTSEEIEEIISKDKHTIVDEITDNIIKIMIVLYLFFGLTYCIVNFTGKDKGVDPNLVYGFFIGCITTIIPTYFAINNFKKNKGQVPQ